MGKPCFPVPLPVGVPGALNGGWDMGKPGFPNPLPGEGLGGLRPPRNTYVHSGIVRRIRMDGCRELATALADRV